MNIHKLNESFTLLISQSNADTETLQQIHNFLKAEKAGAKYDFKVQRGWESPYRFFTSIQKDTNNNVALKINNGHLELVKQYGISDEKIKEIFGNSDFDTDFINKEFEYIKTLLPFAPYDYQEKCAKDCITNPKQISLAATGAGKSLIIFMIIYFMYRNNKKGYIVVPNINLLSQLIEDFKDYFKDDTLREQFLESIETQGGGNSSTFDKPITISTWQSLMNKKEVLDKAEYIICDELHRYASEMTSEIVKLTTNAKYKWGLTGTLPDDEEAKMELIGMFGFPKRYIRTSELISRGLATPVKINSLYLCYNSSDKAIFNNLPRGNFAKQLCFIKEHEARNNFVVNLSCKVRSTGNTLTLFTHTEHGKTLFLETMKKLHPDVVVQNKDITGKKSFEFQEKYGIYFLNGEDDPKTRELTRKILEEHKNCILFSNYSILSTGVNIKALFNIIFSSPLKSYTTISQSVGRGIRLHKDKTVCTIYDLIDDFGFKKPGGVFVKQYLERCSKSYNPEEFPIQEVHYTIS